MANASLRETIRKFIFKLFYCESNRQGVKKWCNNSISRLEYLLDGKNEWVEAIWAAWISILHKSSKYISGHTLEIIGNKAHMHKYLYKLIVFSQEIEEINLDYILSVLLGMQYHFKCSNRFCILILFLWIKPTLDFSCELWLLSIQSSHFETKMSYSYKIVQ